MTTIKIGVSFFYVLAFSVLMMEGARGRLERNATSSGLMNSLSSVYSEDTILLNCFVGSTNLREVRKSSASVLVYGMVNDHTKTIPLPKCGMLDVVTSLLPAMRHAILKCLIIRGFHLGISRHDHFPGKIYSGSLNHPVLRRRLAVKDLQNSGPVFALMPSPAPVLVPSPIISPSQTEANGAPEHVQNFPNGEGNRKNAVILAAVLSSTGTFLLLAGAFCCYRKCLRRNNSPYVKDESPLSNLNMSNFSGSSNKFMGSGNSIRMGPLPSKIDSNRNNHAIAIDSSPDDASLSGIISGYSSAPNVPPLKSANWLEPNVELTPPPGVPLWTPDLPPSSTPIDHSPAPFPSSELTSTPPAAPPPPPPPPPHIAPSIKKASPTPPTPPPPPSRKPCPPLPPGSRPPPPNGHPSQGNPKPRPSSLGADHLWNNDKESGSSTPKTKLKPFFWDKVLASPDQSMVWHHIRSGSFEFSEETIETLFGYNATAKPNGERKKKSSSNDSSAQHIQILNPKKSQNLTISLKALNVKSEDVCNALMEGEELPTELLQTLLKMQPTTDEELKLRLYAGDLLLLGPAEQFLKAVIDIPFAFKRMDMLLFMSSLYEDVTSTKESLATLEEACTELRNNRLFLKLLEAVLKTGNRMNDGTFRGGAQAFKLDTLLKLADVKGSDGKTTLLHFVVQEIVRSEGVRAAHLREYGSISELSSYSFNSDGFPEDSPRAKEGDYYILGLKVVSGLNNELENVKKAAGIDIDVLISGATSFGLRLVNIAEFLNKDMKNLGEDSGFHHSLKHFVEHAEAAITFLLEEEKRIRSLVQKTTNYFHGNAGKDEGLRLFVIVRDFLGMLDKACKEIREAQNKVLNPPKVKSNSNGPSVPDPRQLFPDIAERQMDNSGSDEEQS